MNTIEQFLELYTDGHVAQARPGRPLVQERWKYSTVVRLQWVCGGQGVEIEHLHGITAQLLPDRRSVAVLRTSPRGRFADALEFIDARGENLFTLRSPLQIDGHSIDGEFAWFESPIERVPPVVRVVFWAVTDDRYYLLDVNSTDGTVAAVLPLQ